MMEKIFLLMSMVPLASTAQESYRPLLSEGKTWSEYADGPVRICKELYLNGDTVIGGETYKKLYEHTTYVSYDNPADADSLPDRLLLPVREESQRVYANDYGKEKLLYDFTMQPGDSMMVTSYEWIRVTSIDTVSAGGSLFRRIHLAHVTDEATPWEYMTDREWPSERPRITEKTALWVEGVGSDRGLTAFFGWRGSSAPYARTSIFDNCMENGETLFTYNDFNAPAWKNPEAGGSDNKKCAVPTIAYDNGRLVFSCETPGAECVYEIKCADTGSGRGNEAILSQTYEIRVHATLEGWQDSDVATATIGWRNGRPVMEGVSSVTMDGADGIGDVNGDGKINVADIATVIDIMAGQTRHK